MLVSEIATRVKRQFGDESGVQVTDSDIIRWVNDAQREIASNNDLMQTVASTGVTATAVSYTLPSDILVLRSVHYEGRKLKALSPQEAEEFLEASVDSGTPTHFWIYANSLNLYPAPDVTDPESTTPAPDPDPWTPPVTGSGSVYDLATYNVSKYDSTESTTPPPEPEPDPAPGDTLYGTGGRLRLFYTRQPTVITAVTATPELPLEYHNRIVEYCLAQAYELDENWEAASQKSAQFSTGLQQLKGREEWQSTDYYPMITSLPEYDYDAMGLYW